MISFWNRENRMSTSLVFHRGLGRRLATALLVSVSLACFPGATDTARVSSPPRSVGVVFVGQLLQGRAEGGRLRLTFRQRRQLSKVIQSACSGSFDRVTAKALFRSYITPATAKRSRVLLGYIAFKALSCSNPELDRLLKWFDSRLKAAEQARSDLRCIGDFARSELSDRIAQVASPCRVLRPGKTTAPQLSVLETEKKAVSLFQQAVVDTNAQAVEQAVTSLAAETGLDEATTASLVLKLEVSDNPADEDCSDIEADLAKAQQTYGEAVAACAAGNEQQCAAAELSASMIALYSARLAECGGS